MKNRLTKMICKILYVHRKFLAATVHLRIKYILLISSYSEIKFKKFVHHSINGKELCPLCTAFIWEYYDNIIDSGLIIIDKRTDKSELCDTVCSYYVLRTLILPILPYGYREHDCHDFTRNREIMLSRKIAQYTAIMQIECRQKPRCALNAHAESRACVSTL